MNLSIVVPVKDEQDSIAAFLAAVIPPCEALQISYEIVFVNDGSQDHTQDVLIEAGATNSQLKIVELSRNFGKELALTAGLQHASGEAIIPMDVDLQDPPELIEAMYREYQKGFDTVVAVREKRSSDSFAKRFFATNFYRLFEKLSDINVIQNAGDFRLISRRVADVVNQMPERTRFMKGILSWPGFSQSTVSYQRPERHTGETKWGFTKLWSLALDGIFSFSTLPLKVWTYLGFSLAACSVLYMLFTIVKTLIFGIDWPGYASLLSAVLLIGGVNLMGIGIVGEYIARIFIEVKGRPTYVVASLSGFATEESIQPGQQSSD